MTEFKRTHYNTELSASDIGSRICVCGWVQKRRDLGSLIFIDLRDRTGIVQLAFGEETDRAVFGTALSTRPEYVVAAEGIVASRGSDANAQRKTGEIEIRVDKIKIIGRAQTPPFEIEDDISVNDELRLRYRYLDLRRPSINENILFRHRLQRATRDFFYDNGFIDIETPNLIKQTPEGARDYVVPSRVHPGKFYALPQSPQLYKQLLMLAGFDRYFQIARCYRDEDLRADRQPEFTQVDLEMSFADESDVMEVCERYIARIFKELLGIEIALPLQRLSYTEATERYGSDKPDLRFGYEITDITEIAKDCGFKVFSEAVASGGTVRGIKFEGMAEAMTRKEMDWLNDYARGIKAKGLAWARLTETPSSSYMKFLSEEENARIFEKMGAKAGDAVLIVADSYKRALDTLGALRCEVAKRYDKIPKGVFKLLWINEFPLFEYNEEDGKYYASHNPFVMPREEDIQYLESEPGRMKGQMYDFVINGYECGGGAIRVSDPTLQRRILNFLGYSDAEVSERFGFMIDAYKYGAPNHGGIAFGLDRLAAIMRALTSIRDVIAFPKVQNASELMSGAPDAVEDKILEELGIEFKKSSGEVK